MEEQKSNDNSGGLCCTKYVRTMRKNFITLTSLCTDLDNMMNMLMMVSYLVDIVLICLLCKVLLFNYAELAARLLLISWIVMPTISLAVLSMHASKLYDTGQGMARFVQGLVVDKVSSDAKVELDLLLFHLDMDPVVMTIWQMIPLNRSIIVSIFVSIITYLTMLLSFL